MGTLPPMFDIAVNLADDQLRNDTDGVLKRAQQAGVNQCLLVGTDIEESHWLAQQFDQLQQPWTAGIHPHYAQQAPADWLDHLRKLQALPGCVAIGECGLDFFRMLSPQQCQIDLCQAQIELAAELSKPVYLHDRDASESLLKILNNSPRVNGVVHCFTSDKQSLDDYLSMGLHIGITAWCLDERRGQALAKLVPTIPSERLLIETDAPYLVPRTLKPRPKRNEPQFLGHIIEGVAALRGENADELARQTTANAQALFQC
ncbi:MAG: TatD family hydrolase [Litorivicinus sp.]